MHSRKLERRKEKTNLLKNYSSKPIHKNLDNTKIFGQTEFLTLPKTIIARGISTTVVQILNKAPNLVQIFPYPYVIKTKREPILVSPGEVIRNKNS